jgi:hypothetical protein
MTATMLIRSGTLDGRVIMIAGNGREVLHDRLPMGFRLCSVPAQNQSRGVVRGSCHLLDSRRDDESLIISEVRVQSRGEAAFQTGFS